LQRSNGFAFDVRRFLYGIDLEEVVEDDEEHGSGAEEDGKTIEIIVRNHLESRFWSYECWWYMLEMLVEKPRNGNVNGRLGRKLALFKTSLDILHY
jgi:hypothetical protein